MDTHRRLLSNNVKCTSPMENNASQNYNAPCEKEEMELSDYEETFTSEMAYDASQNYSAPCEKEEMEPSNYRVISSICFSQVLHLYRTGRCFYPPGHNISEEMTRENIKFMAYMSLLAILFGNNGKRKFLAKPDRGKISCITVYLLGNDGAHSYNGNGILLSTRRKYTRFKDEELLDEIQPANLPLDVLQRQPTDKEIARISGKIGKEYRRLAYELGLTRVQLDHLTEDYRVTEHRIERMLFKWRDGNGRNATFEILVNALDVVGTNPDIVSQSLERA